MFKQTTKSSAFIVNVLTRKGSFNDEHVTLPLDWFGVRTGMLHMNRKGDEAVWEEKGTLFYILHVTVKTDQAVDLSTGASPIDTVFAQDSTGQTVGPSCTIDNYHNGHVSIETQPPPVTAQPDLTNVPF